MSRSTKATLRLAMAALLALTVLLSAELTAKADGGMWCMTDPVVNVAGRDIHIFVAIPAEYQTSVTGPIAVQIATGPHVPRSLIATDGGFNGLGERVKFVVIPSLNDSVIIVSVQVPISSAVTATSIIPVQLMLAPDGGDSVTVFGASWATVGSLQLAPAGG